ncbi:MAG TPA: TM0106 family RecB-like putative nuclease [Chromatiaceae bacterium]|nr:TM0106 family RecB-like putative nuclease [Chromatiaceae bacterium]
MNLPKIKPSDSKSWSLCHRRVWIDNKTDLRPTEIEDEFQQLIVNLGLQHEQAVLDQLSRTYQVHKATSPEDTQRLMSEGAEVIYQAQLIDEDENFVGYPDFLIRHENGSYQPADAKLSLSEEKKDIQVQLGFYRRMLDNGLPAIVYLGDGSEAVIGDESIDVTNQFVDEMHDILSSDVEPSVRYSHSKCRACPYYTHCKPAFEAREELSLLYGVHGRSVQGLNRAGIDTITTLANTDPENIPEIPYLKGFDKHRRAVLQADSYLTGAIHQINDFTLPEGYWVHFDIEDNPLTESGDKHVYLWGFLIPSYHNDDFEYVWTDTEKDDRDGWIIFLEKIDNYRRNHPDLIIAHYSSHERTTIKAYAKRYSMENNEIVLYLLGDDSPLYDMQKPVLNNFVLPLQAYGLKDICKHKDLVNFQWEDNESGSQWSIVQFHRFLAETDLVTKDGLKSEILGYNRDDVIATRKLEEWLRSFRRSH